MIPPGEYSKTDPTEVTVEEWVVSEKCTLDRVLIALGGSVMSNMIGYVWLKYSCMVLDSFRYRLHC